MRAHDTYDYAVIRVVPRVEREEFVNVGIILSCERAKFLEARIELDEARLLALDPTLTWNYASDSGYHSGDLPRRRSGCTDRPAAAACALPLAHGQTQFDHPDIAGAQGRCGDLAATLEHLMDRMVRPPKPPCSRRPSTWTTRSRCGGADAGPT